MCKRSITDIIKERQAGEGKNVGVEDKKKTGGPVRPLDVIKGTFGAASKPGTSAPTTIPKGQGGEGYSLLGTLTRAGPIPLFYRIALSSQYEAAVDKFILREGCSRAVAMANMDYYFRNPNDWIALRKREEKTGVKVDLLNMNQDPTSLALVAFWGTLSTFYIWRIYAFMILGRDYKTDLLGFGLGL